MSEIETILLAACKSALKALALGATALERANAIRDLRKAIAEAEGSTS